MQWGWAMDNLKIGLDTEHNRKITTLDAKTDKSHKILNGEQDNAIRMFKFVSYILHSIELFYLYSTKNSEGFALLPDYVVATNKQTPMIIREAMKKYSAQIGDEYF